MDRNTRGKRLKINTFGCELTFPHVTQVISLYITHHLLLYHQGVNCSLYGTELIRFYTCYTAVAFESLLSIVSYRTGRLLSVLTFSFHFRSSYS